MFLVLMRKGQKAENNGSVTVPFHRFLLQNPSEPNLLRDYFPYTEVPRVCFDNVHVPMALPDDFWITDTTFRDGQQARPPYTVEQIVTLYKFLHRMGGKTGVIRQCEFFLYTERDREAVEQCRALGYRYPEITGWIRAVKSDFKLVKDMGLQETGILTSASDYHIYLKLKKDRKAALEDYLDIVRAALEEGIIPRCHFEDITRADFYGFIIPFAQELMKLSSQSRLPVKIRACDTMGLGLPYPEVELPRSIPRIMHALRNKAGVPSEWLEWHGHNDFHKSLVNAVTAWLYGCSGANGTLLGFGERTGNTPVEALLIDYIGLKGNTHGVDTTAITDAAVYSRNELAVNIPCNYPFVGEDFNVTRAGIHADGILKSEEIYNIFDTGRLLKRPLGVAITDKSGLAGVAEWVNLTFNLERERKIEKHHPGVLKIHEWVQEEYRNGRITAISDVEMRMQTRKHVSELFVSQFEKIKKSVGRKASRLLQEQLRTKEILSTDKQEREHFLKKIIDQNPFVQLAYITDASGKLATRYVSKTELTFLFPEHDEGHDLSDRPWFKGAVSKRTTPYISEFYVSLFTNALCVTVASPIRDTSGNALGVIGLDLQFEEAAKIEDEKA